MYNDIPEHLRLLIEPVVEQAGLELVDLTLTRGPQPWQLRVVIDTSNGDGRIAIERCAQVAREVGTNLDAADAIEKAYRLEVTSPGLDRVLAREKDFVAARGTEVRLETRRPLDGRRRFRGRLLDFLDGTARLSVDGKEVEIPFVDVAKAQRVYSFTSADFAGSAREGARI